MPGAITQQQHDHARDDAPASRQMTGLFIRNLRYGGRVLVMASGDFFLEALDHGGDVEAQIAGVTAHEADRIGLAGKTFDPVFLDRVQMFLANLERARNRGKVFSTPEPRGAQILADSLKRGFAVAGDFTQVKPAPAAFTVQA